MLDKTTRIVSESFARALNRRSFLKRTGEVIFGATMAVAAGHVAPTLSSARGIIRQPPVQQPNCSPPGPYCNTGGGILTGCHGAGCFQHLYNGQVVQCRVYYQYYQVGCWTSGGSGGYWTCCDCECSQNGSVVAHCGCAQFSQTPAPRPDRPTGGASRA
jgi:hypothetical protein